LPTINIENIEKLLDLSIFLKDKSSANPVSILSVVSNNEEAELNIIKAKNKLQEFVHQASASETKVNVITTIDHNAASGIIRISREIMSNIIILGWPQRIGILDKLIGDKMDSILNNTDKTLFICSIEKPLILHKRIFIVVPPLAEREYGFQIWLSKIVTLSQELSIPIILYSNTSTKNAVERFIKKSKASATVHTELFESWEDFLIISRNILVDDLFILISARKGSTSYMSLLENLPTKIEKHFTTNSHIVIYPQQYDQDYITEGYEDISAEPINKSIETIQKLSKGIANIFKR